MLEGPGRGVGSSAAEAARRAAEEAARRAGEEAARRAAEEAARRAAAAAAERAQAEATAEAAARSTAASGGLAAWRRADIDSYAETPGGAELFSGRTAGAPRLAAQGTGISVGAAMSAASQAPNLTAPAGATPVQALTAAGAGGVMEEWVATGARQIGVGDPMVYRTYLETHGAAMQAVANMVGGSQPDALTLAGGRREFDNMLIAPALDNLHSQHPDATFEVIATEGRSVVLPFGGSATTVIAMTEDGATQYFAIDAPDVPDRWVRFEAMARQDPALAAAWHAAAPTESLADRSFAVLPEQPMVTLSSAITGGAHVEVAQGVAGLPPELRQAVLADYAQNYLVAVDAPLPDDIVVTADVTERVNGRVPASVSSSFNVAGVDGLAESTPINPPYGMSQADWRGVLETVAGQPDPPSTVAELRTALAAAGMSEEQILRLSVDPGTLPAVMSLVADEPDVSFNAELNIRLTRDNSRYALETVVVDGETRVYAVVETSLNALVPTAQATLREDYAVSDVPITLRVPLPAGIGLPGASPGDPLPVIQYQIDHLPSAQLFLHGYQSTRAVWQQEMQDWMQQAPGDTIGIAFAGMGSEGTTLGFGGAPITPRQYAFQTMEQLDQLGLYGKELTVVGHSMGGAAGLQMGLTIDAMRPPAERPEMRYVLLAPAVGPDSVPFLMHGIDSMLISLQNSLGTVMPPELERQMVSQSGYPEGRTPVPPSFWAYLGNLLVGPNVVNGLIPGAPQHIRDVHSSFANEYGFQALASQASGLLHQSYADPDAVSAFLRDHPVVVVAATEDKLVDPAVVEGVFGPSVLTVEGNHYAHLGNLDHPEWGPVDGPAPERSPRDLVWDRVRAMLARPYRQSPGGGGGSGRANVR